MKRTVRESSAGTGKRGRKTDVGQVRVKVEKAWDSMDATIRKRIMTDLPTRASDARKHVLRVASNVLAGSIRTRKTKR